MSPELIAALAGLVTATGAVITGIFATRSKVKLDDMAKLHATIDELEADLAEEKAARDADDSMHRARHNRIIADYEERLDVLNERLRQRDQTITHLDRVVLALRTYAARARRALVAADAEVPDDVEGMNG